MGWDKNVSTKTVLVHVFVSSNLRVCMSVFAVVVYLSVLVYFFCCIFGCFLLRCATISSFSGSNQGLVGGSGMHCKSLYFSKLFSMSPADLFHLLLIYIHNLFRR